MRLFFPLYSLLFLCYCVLNGCTPETGSEKLFERISSSESGIYFINQIEENDTLNVIDYPYIYNGSGVGVGDVNNDGLTDIFFAGNAVNNQLYLNRTEVGQGSRLQFEDISQQANININRWCTGVAMIDINQDGYLDIYVSVANKFNQEASRNLLFINDGNDPPSFSEMAQAYGLDDEGYSTQAAFLDYDKDGDLDMYLLTNGMETFSHNNTRPKKTNGEGVSNDKLYRNEGIGPGGHPVFKDVSREAGILTEGYGLGITVNDLNQDGWPDVYAANDFITNDLMWINNGEGSFTDKATDYLKHQSHNGMGTDIADYNNDGLVDIVVLDMLPEDNLRQKTMLPKMNFEKFDLALDMGYTPQYMRNTLQLNNGLSPSGELSFSEIGHLAGIYKTDWSWSSLFADYDNDGYRDLLITNGYAKDVTDLDYIMYQSSATQFGTPESRDSTSKQLTSLLKPAKVHNYIYRNQQDLTFEDKSEAWGIATPSFSNGTAFADLDNDGDLDLVMNNINDEAFIYQNQSKRENSHYISFRLQGPEGNLAGLGTKITLWYNGQQQYHYHTVYRGYKSSVDEKVHFGLGQYTWLDSIWVEWPDGNTQQLYQVNANQMLKLNYKDAQPLKLPSSPAPAPLLTMRAVPKLLHQENDFIDFHYQSLLPRRYSRDGPALAVGDINGDGLDDMYMGGANGFSGYLLVQQANGSFATTPLEEKQKSEDMGALFFDADQDGDNDLYVVSGGNEFYEGHEAYQDRLYLNDGQGNFTLTAQALPDMKTSGSCVVAADYDQDGDLDLFVGGRLRPQKYPLPPRSYILRNNGGTFTDVTESVAPALSQIGLVTAALWTDFDDDGQVDLLVAGEWMPLTFMRNQKGKFENETSQTGLPNTSGWWNSLLAEDFDQDGDLDYVAGNLGLNSKFSASAKEPLSIYVKDFDQNNTIDPIMAYYNMGEEYPVAPRDALLGQIIQLRRRFPRYEIYGQAKFSDVFTGEELEDAYVLQSVHIQSSYLENLGNGKFKISHLPLKAQFAPIYGMLAEDVNADGHPDLICVGNSYATETQTGQYDAGIGNVLLGNGKGDFLPASMQQSGFWVDTDAKALTRIMGEDQQPQYWISSNADSLKAYAKAASPQDLLMIPLRYDDFFAIAEYKNGKTYKREFHYGEGYLSQSSRTWCVAADSISEVTIYNYSGSKRSIDMSKAQISYKNQ